MQSVLVTLLAVMAATGIAVPVSMETRQLPSLSGANAVAGVVSQLGKEVPANAQRLSGSLNDDKKDKTGKDKKKSDPVTSLLSGLGLGSLGV